MQLCRVHGECTALRESFVTVRTGVRLFAGVCSYVFREIVLHAEGLLTVATMKWFFTCNTNKMQNIANININITPAPPIANFTGCRAVPKTLFDIIGTVFIRFARKNQTNFIIYICVHILLVVLCVKNAYETYYYVMR